VKEGERERERERERDREIYVFSSSPQFEIARAYERDGERETSSLMSSLLLLD